MSPSRLISHAAGSRPTPTSSRATPSKAAEASPELLSGAKIGGLTLRSKGGWRAGNRSAAAIAAASNHLVLKKYFSD
jgi:hypothetical protein